MTGPYPMTPSHEQYVGGQSPIEVRTPVEERLVVTRVATREQWETLQPEWWALFEETRGCAGQSPIWTQAIQGRLDKRSTLCVLTIRDKQRLVGIVPMVATRRAWLGVTIRRELRFIQTGQADDFSGRDALVLPGIRHDAALALSAYLLEHPGMCDRLVLKDVGNTSFAAEFLPPLWEALGWEYSLRQGSEYFSLPLPRLMEEFGGGCDAETRKILATLDGPADVASGETPGRVSTSDTVDAAIAVARASNDPRPFQSSSGKRLPTSHTERLLQLYAEKGWLWSATSTSPDGEWAGCAAVMVGETATILYRHKRLERGGIESLNDKKVLLTLVQEAIHRGCTELQFEGPEPLFARHRSTHKAEQQTITLSAPRTAAYPTTNRVESVTTVATPQTRSGNEYEITALTTDQEFFALRVEWERLVTVASAGIFQTFDWQWTWWRHFGRQKSLFILEIRRAGSLVGLLPLFCEKTTLAGYLIREVLRPIGSPVPRHPIYGPKAGIGVTDYVDMIADPEHAEAMASGISRYLKEQGTGIDALLIRDAPSSGQIPRMLVPALSASGFRVTASPSDLCPFLPTPASVDAFIDGLDGQTKRRFHKARQLTKVKPGFSLEVVRSEKVVRSVLQDLIHLHQVRWRRLGSTGLFDDPRFRAFMLELAPVLFSKGQLWIGAIVMGGVRTAVRLAFRWNGRLYDYVAGFDDALPGANKGPGYTLLLALIDDAVKNDVATIDLLRGKEPYKFDITDKNASNTNIVVKFPGARFSLKGAIAFMYDLVILAIQQVNKELHVLSALREHKTFSQSLRTYISITSGKFARRFRGQKPVITPRKETKLPSEHRPASSSRIIAIPLLQKIRQGLERDSDLPMRHVFRKGLVFLRSLAMAPFALRSCTSVGKRPRTRGWPLIENDGNIRIGDDFNINSRQVPSELAAGPGGTLLIGNEVSINRGSSLCALDRIEIGNRVRIGPYSLIMDSDFHVIGKRHARATTHPVFIGDDVWIGSRVTILKGAAIGVGSVITAGSVVSGQIPSGVVAGGVPARVIRKLSNHRPLPADTDQPKKGRSPNAATEEVISKVKQVFARIFRVDEPETLTHGPFDTPQWDSLGQLNLIVAIEEAFDIRLTDEDMLSIVDLRSLCDIVAAHVVAKRSHLPRQEDVRI